MFEEDLYSGSCQLLLFDVVVALIMLRQAVLCIGAVGQAGPCTHTQNIRCPSMLAPKPRNLFWVEVNPDPPQELVATHLCTDHGTKP